MILLYIFNKLLLGGETLHSFNRYVWLATIVVSFSLPFAIRDYSELMASDKSQETLLDGSEMSQSIMATEIAEISMLEIVINTLFVIYIIGAISLIIYNIVLHLLLINIIRGTPQLLDGSSSEDDRALIAHFRSYERYNRYMSIAQMSRFSKRGLTQKSINYY